MTRLLCCLLAAVPGAFADTILFNEVMYHPAPAVPEDPGQEWVELYNAGTNDVELAGWQIDSGVSFTFPSNTTLRVGGYLVVAASRTNFLAHYPSVTNVVGDWEGKLSNSGEQLRLRNAQGDVVDSLNYADGGEWAVRQRVPDPTAGLPGWDWLALADGSGRSMELIQPLLSNTSGQNWAPSQGAGGTPGFANSTRQNNVAPLIVDASHFPAVPKPGQTVAVTARLVDEQPASITALVYYRNATSTSPGGFASIGMFDDGAHDDGLAGDGLYGAVLPAQTNGAVIEFYIEAFDGVLKRTYPAPALIDGNLTQTANALYQVDSNEYGGSQQILRAVLTGAERQSLLTINPNSDAEMNATIVSIASTGTEIRYNSGIRIRGAGSRSRPTKNYRVNFPSDRPWNGLTAINLNSQYPHAQLVGSVLAQKSGLPAANARFVQLRVNGVNLVREGPPDAGDGASWGSYVLVEPINNEWAGIHFPTDPNGNVYRASSGGHLADLSYQGQNPTTYRNRGYSKTSNQSEDDWSDLINLVDVLNNTPNPQYIAAVQNRLNVTEWMTYFAVFSLMEYTETSLGAGEGDDYSLYRGLTDTRFKVIGHDFDTIFGQGDTAGNINESIWVAADVTDQPAVDKFMKFPGLAPLFYEQLLRLANANFLPEQLNPLFDQLLTGVATEPTITAMKNFAASRRLGVLAQIPQVIRITNSLPNINGYPTTTTPTVSLTGAAHASLTRSVRVNGQAATWTPWRASWSIAGVPLQPGVNRILVQAFDGADKEVQSATVDILYDDGSVADVAADITADTTWSAAGGPYRVTSSITVQNGATLTIQPGTTVYLGQGVNLTVANGGRLLAEGTAGNGLRFTRVPATNGTWGGITINGGASSPETRIAYAHFEFNNATAIHANDGTVFLDHLTFGNTDRQYVSLDRSSFVVQDCVFPSATAPFELVHGTGGVKAGGRALFLRNFFGRPIGYNDVVDFTGGNRPGPIAQFINNVFIGTDDDILDLDSTDAWVEGNLFMHCHRNGGSPDSSSAISGGADNADTSQVTILGNLFYDVDQVANAKQGNFYTLIHNTVVRQTHVGGIDPEAGVVILADDTTTQGLGTYLEGNIVQDAEMLTRNVTTALVTFTNNLMNLPWSGPGGANTVGDALLKHIPTLAETTNFTTLASAQILRQWFSLQEASAARGRGAFGRDLGGVQPLGAFVAVDPRFTGPDSVVFGVGPVQRDNGVPTNGFPEGSGYTAYRWRLDGGAWSAETPIGTSNTLSGLTVGTHVLEVSGKRDCGFYQDDPVYGPDAVVTTYRFDLEAPQPGRVVLNEVLAANVAAVPVNGGFPDLVELYNPGDAAVDLSGWGVTDEAVKRFKYQFPAGTVLQPGAYLVLVADEATGPGIHLGFALEQRGETLSLFGAGGELVDRVEFGIQLPDISLGRGGDGEWTLVSPSLGAPNVAHSVADPAGLKINEWLANSRSVFPEDFIEIYNPAGAPVNLGGLHLTDEPLGWPGKVQVPALTFMGAGAHFVFLADGHPEDGADHLDFKLASERGALGLFDRATNLIDCVFYAGQAPDVSEGRQPSGGAVITSFAVPTPGAPNPVALGSTTITSISTNLLATNAVWKYEQSNIDLGVAWRAANYNDAGWSSGPGLLGFDNDFNPQPFTTLMTLANGKITFYYRTTFNMPTNPTGWRLEGSMYLDDGAVIYLNGVEANRTRMRPGLVDFTTLANPTVDNFTRENVTISAATLLQGQNTLAVEVHQSSTTSGDVAWGLELNAVRSFTNTVLFGVVLNEVLARNASFTNGGGTNLSDWVELYNPSTAPFDLSGLSLSDDLLHPALWVFPAGTLLAPGGYLTVRCDDREPASTNAGPDLNTGFALGGEGGDAVYLFDSAARTNALLDSIAFGIQVPDYSIGRIPNGRGTWALTLPTPSSVNIAAALGSSANLVINEWLANPSGNDEDFLELYNPLPQPVSLSGLILSDSLTNRAHPPVRALSFIGAGENGFVRFVADGDIEAGADHVNFNLRSSGELIALFNPAQQLITSVTFGPQENGVSEGRFPDASTNIVRFRGTPTPGRSNLLPLSTVAVNEVLTHTDPPFEDAIELENLSTVAVDISGWYVTDDRNDPKRFRVPAGTVLAPRGRVVFYEYQFNPEFSGRIPGFGLSSASGDEVYLFTADAAGNLTGFRTGVRFGAAARGVSIGSYLTSVGTDFTTLRARTFGEDTPATVEQFRLGSGLPNALPLVGPIVLSEVMYHPPDIISGTVTNDDGDNEFIELLNMATAPIPLYDPNFPTNTWRLRDAVDFEFPQGVTLAPGGRVVVVGFDPATNATALAAFRAKYGIDTSVPLYGPWRGRLANDSENVELYRPDEPEAPGTPNAGFVPYLLADKVKYGDSLPWPAPADGHGQSLHRLVDANYGNDPVNWVAANPTPGTPNGVPNPGPVIAAFSTDHEVEQGSTELLTVTVNGTGPFLYQWRINGTLIPAAGGATFAIPNFQLENAGIYSVLVANASGSASASVRLSLRSAPFIQRQPQNAVVIAGNTAIFSVVAGGSEPLTYQWQKAGANISGATNLTLVITNAQAGDAANYRVVINNPHGSVTSSAATLDLNLPPVIVAQPRSTNVFVGATATLTVSATGSAPLRYQWRFSGTNIAGATNASFTLFNIQLANAGEYRVQVLNAVGSALSEPAMVAVYVPPVVTIAATGANASETAGNYGQFTFTRTGPTDASLSVNFSVSGIAVSGSDFQPLVSPILFPAGTNATVLTVVPNDDNVLEGNETVTVTVGAGASYVVGTPASATVIITDNDNIPPQVAVTSPPDGTRVNAPTNVTLIASAVDPDGSVTRVEFYADGTNRLGQAVQTPYTIVWTNAAIGTHQITAVATDNLGSTGVSAPLNLIVNGLPSVSVASPPDGAILPIGSDITIVANASDVDGNVTLVEFFQNGTLLGTDATSPYTYVWQAVPGGEYVLTARATDNRGTSRTSAPSTITVGTPPARFGDDFARRGVMTGFTNTILGNTAGFTREAGEPKHDGRNGTHSGWISWTAPASGPCVLDTFGSAFDTVLAVYTNSSLALLGKVVSNDDANQDTSESQINFNAVGGTVYQIAIDGFSATAAGAFTFHCSLPNPLPIILEQPQSQVVTQGVNVTFSVTTTGPGPQRYQWRFNNGNINNATNRTLVRNNVGAANDGTYVVVVSNSSGSVTSAPAILSVITQPFITTQPADQNVLPGSNVTFFVRATGLAPIGYQWRYNGNPIAGATASNLVLTSVFGRDEGLYSVVLSNGIGVTTSRDANLAVSDGLIYSRLDPLLNISNQVWRYHVDGANLSNGWRAVSYDDSSWSNGIAMFGLETTPQVYPEPFRTAFSLTGTNGAPIQTYYLRTDVLLPNPRDYAALFVTAYVDDGAVWYLNGREAARLRIPANVPVDGVLATTAAQNLGTEGPPGFLILLLTNTVAGSNLLAVEVHQGTLPSSDVVFGMSMDAVVILTNNPVMLLPEAAQPGQVKLGLAGVVGRNYAIDESTDLTTWQPIVVFTNFNSSPQSVEVPYDGAGNRFYRGRLVR
jgi:hypothetical protein